MVVCDRNPVHAEHREGFVSWVLRVHLEARVRDVTEPAAAGTGDAEAAGTSLFLISASVCTSASSRPSCGRH